MGATCPLDSVSKSVNWTVAGWRSKKACYKMILALHSAEVAHLTHLGETGQKEAWARSKLKPANACLTTVDLENPGVSEVTGPGSGGLRKGSSSYT